MNELPAFTLSLGVILNLNKWIQYLCKIVVFVSVNTNDELENSFIQNSEASAFSVSSSSDE